MRLDASIMSKIGNMFLCIVCCTVMLLGLAVVGYADNPPGGPGGSAANMTGGPDAVSGGGDTALPDLFTGTMSYRIPIKVTPGRNGMEPDLALIYRSNSGNSWIGTGWDLEVGAIERSRRKGVNYTADSYILRGNGSAEELVSVSEFEYRAKIESAFSRIQLHTNSGTSNSGRYWVLTKKNGMKYYYGGTNNSEQSGANATFKWCLNRIEDLNGNFITFSYSPPDQGQIYLNRIDYNNNYIQFNLEPRDDSTVMYDTHFGVNTAYRLKSIDIVGADGNRVRAYKLGYTYSQKTGKSLLTSFQEFGQDAAIDASGTVTGDHYLPPMTFEYSPENSGFSKTSFSLDGSDSGGILQKDITGDGATDLLKLSTSTSEIIQYVANGHGFDKTPYAWGKANFSRGGDAYYAYHLLNIGSQPALFFIESGGKIIRQRSYNDGMCGIAPFEPLPLGNGDLTRYIFADFNGDGMTDVLYNENTTGVQKVALGTINDPVFFDQAQTWLTYGDGTVKRYFYQDFNGDGKTDLLYIESNGDLKVALSNGTGFDTPQLWGNLGNGDPTRYIIGDFNGDGNKDILYVFPSSGKIDVALSTGTGFANSTTWLTYGDGNPVNYKSLDFNADGKSDFLYIEGSSKHYIGFSHGDSFKTPSLWGDFGDTWKYYYEFNADAKPDILIFAKYGPFAYDLYTSDSKKENVLTGVKNGIGSHTGIQYKLFSGTHNGRSVPLYVVDKISSCYDYNNANSTCNKTLSYTSYNYDESYYNSAERDFRGFRYATVTGPVGPNGEHRTTTETYFHQ